MGQTKACLSKVLQKHFLELMLAMATVAPPAKLCVSLQKEILQHVLKQLDYPGKAVVVARKIITLFKFIFNSCRNRTRGSENRHKQQIA